MIDAVSEPTQSNEPERMGMRVNVGPRRWRRTAGVGAIVLVGLGLGAWAAGRAVKREFNKQRYELQTMSKSIEAAAAPGELVIVDHRLLGWALRQGGSGELKSTLLTVGDDASPASVLNRLAERSWAGQEFVLVARPQDKLVHAFENAGFHVTKASGPAAWDLGGSGRGLLGRCQMRLFFVTPPEPTIQGAGVVGAAVSSGTTK